MFDAVRTAATTAAQNLRQAAKDLGKAPTAPAPAGGDATAEVYQADRWEGPSLPKAPMVLPKEPRVVPKEPRLPFLDPMPAFEPMPGHRGCEGERINELSERLERLYAQQEQVGDQLAQARIKAHGSDDPRAKMAVKLLEARKGMIDMRVAKLEEERTALMDRWTWAHNDGPANLK